MEINTKEISSNVSDYSFSPKKNRMRHSLIKPYQNVEDFKHQVLKMTISKTCVQELHFWLVLFIFITCMFVEFVEHDITLCEHDEKVTLSCPDQTATSNIDIAVGNFSCGNITNDECLSFIYGKLFFNCHEQNMCVLTPETVFHESCQRAARYLKLDYSCICKYCL